MTVVPNGASLEPHSVSMSVQALHSWKHGNTKKYIVSNRSPADQRPSMIPPPTRPNPNTRVHLSTVILNETTIYREIGDLTERVVDVSTQRRRHPSSCRYLVSPRSPNRRVSRQYGRSRRQDDGRMCQLMKLSGIRLAEAPCSKEILAGLYADTCLPSSSKHSCHTTTPPTYTPPPDLGAPDLSISTQMFGPAELH